LIVRRVCGAATRHVDPALFKAVVAIAPVTDLAALKEQYRNRSNFGRVSVGASCELVTWDELDHYLEDSDARANAPQE
jgi:hypothetical protein